jgi:hypothetical protein
MRVAHTASAVNYVQVTGSATGNLSAISAQGSDTNTFLAIQAKGTGYVAIANASSTVNQALRVSVNGAVNTGNLIQINPAAAGSAPSIQAISGTSGTDTNIDLALTPKGTGVVRAGAYEVITTNNIYTYADPAGTAVAMAIALG